MSSVELKLDASVRTEQGRGASRRLRREKRLPAIVYGAGKGAQAITVSEQQVGRLMREEAFFSQIIDLAVDGKSEQVILKDLQRHPFKPLVSHLDFMRVKANEKLRTHVPLHFLNEETAKGVKQGGGVIHHDLIEVEVECYPRDLPEFIEVDVQDLELDSAMHLSEVSVPKGVTLPALGEDAEHDPAVVSIHAPRKAKEEDEEAAEEAEGGEQPSAEAEGGEEEGGED
ncbi:50S ribosomal protein L25 [wastewater metagenome]|uniref:50S ribosomal protein L25 n=2 Tax=unclassified sequences TaxID=12908 RepID=A0A5B8R640_9ZZZZ|nr:MULTISPECIES: 50S ribosomal protein L25/general stress protein Ctc [Arhodomonas]MCS4504113.1 50S ribosomal protein L25/general stress protein Ctc [Arhodomonas aquaeolei]QEA03911.1 50S ribosomal protein L25 [uncultured organism]